MKKNRYLYLVGAIFLIIGIFIFSYLLYKDWGKDWKATVGLAGLVIAQVVGFLADLRALLAPEPVPPIINVQIPPPVVNVQIPPPVVNVQVVSQPSSQLTGLHQIPAPPVDFTGRKEELNSLLHTVQSGGVLICTLGPDGIGKTALALVLAEKLAVNYPDAQFYMDLKGTPGQTARKPEEIMMYVLHGFEPLARLPENVDELRGLYCSALAGKHALLLLDNVRGREQVEPLLPPAGCLLLVTSRQHFDLPGLAFTNLERLPEADAINLLRAIAPHAGEQAGALVRACGCLPLALRVVGSLLKLHPDLAVEDVLRRLEAGKQRMDEVDASLSLSYDGLADELKRSWRELAIFPGTFDLVAAAEVWGLEVDAAQERMSELWDYSLVEYEKLVKRYALHDLGRGFAGRQLKGMEQETVQARHAQNYLQVLNKAERLYLKGGQQVLEGLKLFDGEWENIATGQAWAAKYTGQEGIAARLACNYPDAGPYVLGLRLHPREHIAWLEGGLAAARMLGNRRYEGVHLGNLGTAYSDLGEPRRAIEYHEQALVIDREIGDRRGEGTELGNLGTDYDRLGKAQQAIEHYELALVIDREIGDRRGEGGDLGNLGLAYAELGKPHRAIEYHEQALAIKREIGDRHGESNVLGNLGAVYLDLGEPRRAIEYHEQALVIECEIGDRRGEGGSLGNLGLAYDNLGEVRRAIEYYEQALDILRGIGDRLSEGSMLDNLGTAYFNLGEKRRAIEYYEQALAIAREIGNRSGEGNSLGNIGIAYRNLGQPRRAIEYYEQQLAITREIDARRGEGNALGNLGAVYLDLGEPRRAIEYHEQALVILREIGDRRGEGTELGNLGLAYGTLDEARRAIGCFDQALVILRETDYRSEEGNVSWNLGLLYKKLGELARAVECMQVRVDYERAIDHPDAEKHAAQVEQIRQRMRGE